MSVPKPALSESAISVTVISPAVVSERRSVVGARAWLLTAVLFLVPLLAYWPATFHDYGLRDDYSNLREARDEPGKILSFCASHARPVYGWLLQATYDQTDTVHGLQWMRLLSSVLLGAIALLMFRGMRALGWSFNTSVCFALLLPLVPSAQVIAGWAIGWPYALTALIAVTGFFLVEGRLSVGGTGTWRAACQYAVALGLMVMSGLIYQPSAMFYVVPLTAALLVQRRRGVPGTLRWVGVHMGFVTASLAISFAIMSVLYDAGVFVRSGRIAFETHWGGKALWYLQENLPNALSVFVINDDHAHGRLPYLAGAALMSLILAAGARLEWLRYGRSRGMIWLAGLIGLPMFACAISLVASEHFATYRTIFAMTAVLLCYVIASTDALTARWAPRTKRLLAAAAVLVAFFTAQHHVYALIAIPQGKEWHLIVEGAKKVRLDAGSRPTVFIVASSPADSSTASVYHDEFGSLSSNSEWVPKEMFQQAMHDLHPDVANIGSQYDLTTSYELVRAPGYSLSAEPQYDVVVDMRRLRTFYESN